LDCGVRGYIGTLWAVENQDAVIAAKTFYDHVFSESVLAAFHKTIKAVDGTKSKDIYIYWGLHFTRFSVGTDIGKSKDRVRKELMTAAVHWAEKITHTKSDRDKEKLHKGVESHP
jgi:L-ascorbate metabolism protein UlaG (beta-lactamase superfamily)